MSFKKTFKKHRENLDVFITLTEGQKLMKFNNHLYSIDNGLLQPFKRWWYDESRKTTNQYLDEFFYPFLDFLKTILKNVRLSKKNFSFSKEICEYINLIIPGLHSLKLTYPKNVEVHCKIAHIITSLLDFKSDISKINTKNINYEY